MPIYEYRCDNGHTFEVLQRMSDAPLISCASCEAPVQRVFHPVAVHFKGSGFYNTDYGKSKAADSADSAAKSGDSKGQQPKPDTSKSESSEGRAKASD
jgi:putative FmdB family regulatory protein